MVWLVGCVAIWLSLSLSLRHIPHKPSRVYLSAYCVHALLCFFTPAFQARRSSKRPSRTAATSPWWQSWPGASVPCIFRRIVHLNWLNFTHPPQILAMRAATRFRPSLLDHQIEQGKTPDYNNFNRTPFFYRLIRRARSDRAKGEIASLPSWLGFNMARKNSSGQSADAWGMHAAGRFDNWDCLHQQRCHIMSIPTYT